MKNAFSIVKDFEEALCEYTGAPYAVAVNSCTNALFLTLAYYKYCMMRNYDGTLKHDIYNSVSTVEIPKHTYVSVPMQIKHAGFNVSFRDENWMGMYQLKPFEVWDAARRFYACMYGNNAYINSAFICVSFHWNKILGVQQGGAILHKNPLFDEWARKARFDGRTEGVAPCDDNFDILGYHMYMSPEIAAEGLVRLIHLPKFNNDLPNDDYPDLSKIELFK